MIPKIIHQIYWDFYGNNKDIPKKWKSYSQSWKDKFPETEYQHILWDYDKSKDLIEKEYNWFLETWNNYPKHIQRVDTVRYFIMYHYGGIYADLDCEVRENFYLDLDQNNINLAGNPYSRNPKHTMNNLMASNKKNEKWKKVFDELDKRKKNIFTLNSTGPSILINSLKEENIKVLSYNEYNPLKKRGFFRHLVENIFTSLDEEKTKGWNTAKVVHHGSESWAQEEILHLIKNYGIIIILLILLIYFSYKKIKNI